MAQAPTASRWMGYAWDLVAILGAGSVLTFLLTNWWLPFLSPVPGVGAHGMAATVVGELVLGVLLGLRARRTTLAAAHALTALVLGLAGFAAVVYAPVTAGVPEVRALVTSFGVSRLLLSSFMAAPAALLGAVMGAAMSE